MSGSDVAFDPPDRPRAARARACAASRATTPRTSTDARPDLVVVGNAIRRGQPGGRGGRAARRDPRTSMSGALREHFLAGAARWSSRAPTARRRPARCARGSCRRAGLEPGWFIGGIPKGLAGAARPSARRACAPVAGGRRSSSRATSTTPSTGTSSPSSSTTSASARTTSPSSRASSTTTSTSTPTSRPTRPRSARFVRKRCPRGALVVCDRARRPRARPSSARCHEGARRLVRARGGRHGRRDADVARGARGESTADGAQPFDLFAGGVSCGRFTLRVPGRSQRAQRGRRHRGVRRRLRR